jgi:hypothetical protein
MFPDREVILSNSEISMSELTKILFVCDESGAKGYADQSEACPGETGVFAGILIPDEAAASAVLQPIHDRYATDGKVHITDLTPAQQESLRAETYAAIQQLGVPCFWYALHVEGLHNQYVIWSGAAEQTRKKFADPRYKRSGRPDGPPSMHVELFNGLYSHLIAFLMERDRKRVAIEVRTDNVDSPIVEQFEAVATTLLSNEPTTVTPKAYDTVTKKVVTGRTMSISVQPSPEYELDDFVVESLSLTTVREGDGIVLAADVLANSLNYLFKNRPPEQRFRALNSPESILEHPLAHYLASFDTWGFDMVGDGLRRHPKCPS